MTRIQRETIAYVLIVGFCILMFTWAIPEYTPAYPGFGAPPALVANVSVGIILAMAGLAIIRLLLARYANKPLPPAESQFPEDTEAGGFTQVGRVNLKHLAVFMVPGFALVLAMEFVPYLIVAFVFLLVLQYAMGNRNWTQMTVIAVVMDALLYVVMRYGFEVPVPGPQIF